MSQDEDFAKWIEDIAHKFNQSRLPPRMWNGLFQYLRNGANPGHFLLPLLENNFVQAAIHADDDNREKLNEWARFMLNSLPMNCWGTHAKVCRWRSMKGYSGTRDMTGTEPDLTAIGD